LETLHINNKWFFAREGLIFIFIGCALTSLFMYLNFLFASVVACIATAFVLFFFRDQDRTNNAGRDAILTPADGTILEVKHLEGTDNPLGQPAIKISVFMSLFNVHVNRIPVTGTVKKIIYQPGKFFSANLDKASKYNENNRIEMETTDSLKIVVVQIAGLIARRIACWVKEGDNLTTGQRFGLIRFGSRLEVYVPDNLKIIAQPHQKVKAGKSIIGYLP